MKSKTELTRNEIQTVADAINLYIMEDGKRKREIQGFVQWMLDVAIEREAREAEEETK